MRGLCAREKRRQAARIHLSHSIWLSISLCNIMFRWILLSNIEQTLISLSWIPLSSTSMGGENISAAYFDCVTTCWLCHRHLINKGTILVLYLEPEAVNPAAWLIPILDLSNELMVANWIRPTWFQVGPFTAESSQFNILFYVPNLQSILGGGDSMPTILEDSH